MSRPTGWSRRRVERRHQVVLMVDTSLSMAGEKMALASVAAAVLALKLHAGRPRGGAVRAAGARAVSRFGEELRRRTSWSRRMLAAPAAAATDIAAALEAGPRRARSAAATRGAAAS